MRSDALILDDYTHGDQKAVLLIVLACLLYGTIEFIAVIAILYQYLVLILLICMLFYIVVFLIGKKGLRFAEGQLYHGITVRGRFVIMRKIKIEKYSFFSYKRKEKKKLHWFFQASGHSIYYDFHECIIYLSDAKHKKTKKLIALTEFDMYYNVRSFLLQHSKLSESR